MVMRSAGERSSGARWDEGNHRCSYLKMSSQKTHPFPKLLPAVFWKCLLYVDILLVYFIVTYKCVLYRYDNSLAKTAMQPLL